MNVKWLWNQCRGHREAIGLLAADTLPEAERQALQQHLAVCPACRDRFEELQAVARRLERSAAAVPEPPFDEEFYFQIVQAICDTELEGTRKAKPAPRLAWLPWSWNRIAWGALGAVWALVLFFNLSAPSTAMSSDGSRQMSAKRLLMVFKADPETVERLVASPETASGQPAISRPQTRRREPSGNGPEVYC